jgi:Ca-activated chloride channel homolog
VGVIQWWVGALVLSATAAVALSAWWLARPRRRDRDIILGTSLDRVRALPGFQALARQEWRSRRVEVACAALALVGTAVMASRLVAVGDGSEEMRTREVVLCLDVSGSMKQIDADVIDSYLALVSTLDEERIGFVAFDAYAVTIFPLTTDHDYIAEQLTATRRVIEQGQVPGTLAGPVGSSLIGDGLASCTQLFDRLDEPRSRTVVLATDNLLSGDAIYTVPQAAHLADRAGVMVFGVMPQTDQRDAVTELRDAVRPTSGDVLMLNPGEPANVPLVSEAIKDQQKTAIMTAPQARSFDVVWPGATLFLLGLAGSLVAAWRRP